MSETDSLTIERRGRPGTLRRDLLIDGHVALTTSRDVVRALDLSDGDQVEIGQLRVQVMSEEPAWAHQRCLRLLNHRDRSSAELSNRLSDDGYSPETISAVVERLVEVELVDDMRFTESFVRGKVAAGWGRRRICMSLESAGIPEATVEAALAAEYPADDLSRARDIATRTVVLSAADANRLANRLIRRGFETSIARKVSWDRLRQGETPSSQDE